MECVTLDDCTDFYDDPALEDDLPLARQPNDPTINQIYGYRNKDGKLIPGLAHEVRTQGFMILAKSPPQELATMSEAERTELVAAEEQAAQTRATLGIPEFHPAWTDDTYRARLQHNPGEFRQRCPEDAGVSVGEYSVVEIMAGLN